MLFDDPDVLTWEEWVGQFEMVNERLPKLDEIQQGRSQKAFHSEYSDEELMGTLPTSSVPGVSVKKRMPRRPLLMVLPILLLVFSGLAVTWYYHSGTLRGDWHSVALTTDFKKMREKSAASSAAEGQQTTSNWVKPGEVSLDSHRNIVRLKVSQTIDKKAAYQGYVTSVTTKAQKQGKEPIYFSYEAWLSFFNQQRTKDAEKLGGSYDAKKAKLTLVFLTLRYNPWTREMVVISVNSDFNTANAFGNYNALSDLSPGSRLRYQTKGHKLTLVGDQLTLTFTKNEEKK